MLKKIKEFIFGKKESEPLPEYVAPYKVEPPTTANTETKSVVEPVKTESTVVAVAEPIIVAVESTKAENEIVKPASKKEKKPRTAKTEKQPKTAKTKKSTIKAN